jgi:hypothetical protein
VFTALPGQAGAHEVRLDAEHARNDLLHDDFLWLVVESRLE